jgi:hypothetical protein
VGHQPEQPLREVIAAFDAGEVDLHARIEVRLPVPTVTTRLAEELGLGDTHLIVGVDGVGKREMVHVYRGSAWTAEGGGILGELPVMGGDVGVAGPGLRPPSNVAAVIFGDYLNVGAAASDVVLPRALLRQVLLPALAQATEDAATADSVAIVLVVLPAHDLDLAVLCAVARQRSRRVVPGLRPPMASVHRRRASSQPSWWPPRRPDGDNDDGGTDDDDGDDGDQ